MLKFISILIALLPILALHAQQITNIKVTQEGDSVVVTYDITSDKPGQTFDIKVECSNDNGKTFSIKPKSLSGDLKGITAGTGKRIVWDVLSERETLSGDHFVFQLVASLIISPDTFSGTSGTFTDSRDGQVYKWIKIGDQIWMAENLAYLPSVSPPLEGSGKIPYYYVYDYIGTTVIDAKATNNYKTYGVLYNWSAAKVACPIGWHLPSDYEWNILVNLSGGDTIAGGKLKEVGISHWLNPNRYAINENGFKALPGGELFLDHTFKHLGREGSWWSSTENSPISIWKRTIYNTHSSIYGTNGIDIEEGFSVRCVKD